MQDLGVMVESQGEVVGMWLLCVSLFLCTRHSNMYADNLEANVEKASSDVVHANEQLGRAVVYKVRPAAMLANSITMLGTLGSVEMFKKTVLCDRDHFDHCVLDYCGGSDHCGSRARQEVKNSVDMWCAVTMQS